MTREATDTIKMTDEEMIDALKGLVFGTFDRTTPKEREALDMAIKALEQKPCGDCISRAKALEMLGDEPENWTDTEKEIQELNDYRWFKSILEELPLVTPKTDVLDKILAEIDQKQYDFMDDNDYDEGITIGLMLAYKIVSKYKAESEK